MKPVTTIILLLLSVSVLAQSPSELPHPKDNHPIDLTNPADLILYVVLPFVLVVLFFIWRKRKKDDMEDKDN